MKEYKFLDMSSPPKFSNKVNELVKAGWKVEESSYRFAGAGTEIGWHLHHAIMLTRTKKRSK